MRILWVLIFCSLYSCSSEPKKPVSKAHPATLVSDLFAVEQGMPIREVKQQEFFFKKCELEGRRPYYTKTEFSCSGL